MDQGRRPEPNRLIQSARSVLCRNNGQQVWPAEIGHSIGWQRGRSVSRILCCGRSRGAYLYATGRAAIELCRMPGVWREGNFGRWSDQRLRTSRGRAEAAGGLVRSDHPKRAVPNRGQKDDGLRGRGAARVARPRRDSLPLRRRCRADRDVEGVRGNGAPRLDRLRSGQK